MQRGLPDPAEGGGAGESGEREPGSRCRLRVQRARVVRKGGLNAEPTQPIGLRAVTGRLLPPRSLASVAASNVRKVPLHSPASAVALGRGSSLAELLGRQRWPCPAPGGPRRTMAWARRDLTSSLSIVITLAACLSATTSEGRKRGGPGVTGRCWGHPRHRCGSLDVSPWA